MREIELDQLRRSRERTLRELEVHLRSTMSLVNKRDVTITSLESRLATALDETEAYRKRLAAIVQRAVTRHSVAHKPAAKRKTLAAAKSLAPRFAAAKRPGGTQGPKGSIKKRGGRR